MIQAPTSFHLSAASGACQSAHARLAPSSAARWIACSGSVVLEALFPETEPDPEAVAGTASHWAGEQMLRGQPVAVGQVTDDGTVLTEEMIDGADMYVDDIRATSPPGAELHVEERVFMPMVGSDNDGTPDCWSFTHNPTTGRGLIDLRDYKFGHRLVNVVRNWQMLDYLMGVVAKLGIDRTAYHLIDVVFTICQPRAYSPEGPIRRWKFVLSDVLDNFSWIVTRAAATRVLAPQCSPNPECRDCRGRHACEALHRAGGAIMEWSSQAIPLNLPPAAQGAELKRVRRAIELLKARADGLEQDVIHSITKRATRVPGFDYVPTAGKEAWNRSDAEIIALGDAMDVKLAKPPAPITPVQARKAGLDPSLVAAFASKRSTGMALVEDDGSAMLKAFGGGS